MEQYLESSEFIDWEHPKVLKKALDLSKDLDSLELIAKTCFEYVRDEIKHSWDFKLNPVTCKASDVLQFGTGYCYAKSHLLAALLRANKIPAALCYQRLTISNNQPPFCLHGLNAIYLEEHGWFRVDPRGNKEGISSIFAPPSEYLAFPILNNGECDFPQKYSKPLEEVIRCLNTNSTFLEVMNNLPDIENPSQIS